MATFYKTSRLWVAEYTYDGRPRHWYRALPEAEDGQIALAAQLRDLYGHHVKLTCIRPATAEEETQYIRGTLPKDSFCPAFRAR